MNVVLVEAIMKTQKANRSEYVRAEKHVRCWSGWLIILQEY